MAPASRTIGCWLGCVTSSENRNCDESVGPPSESTTRPAAFTVKKLMYQTLTLAFGVGLGLGVGDAPLGVGVGVAPTAVGLGWALATGRLPEDKPGWRRADYCSDESEGS